MKKAFFLLLFVSILFLGSYKALQYARTYTARQLAQTVTPTLVTPTVVPTVTTENKHTDISLFVPYWTVTSHSNDLDNYGTLLYFGVSANENGLDTTDQGYKNLSSFLSVSQSHKKLLVLRMINSQVNFKILGNKSLQQKIISQVTVLAKENGFSGIVLDLEVSALPFDSLIQQITNFNKDLYTGMKLKNLSYTIAIYGDAFYRIRPFDVKNIAKSADQVLVMAYDFTKANSNPGPTFPLHGKDTYGYDTESMLADFLQVVPANKLNVAFGLFGYDWTVDDKKKANDSGDAITAKEAEDKYMTDCQARSCSWKRDDESFGIQVNYTDDTNSNHIVWIDDMQAINAKQQFLKARGINNFSYWAYTYF